MIGKIRNYYADGNTAKGFYSLHNSNISKMEHLYIINGAPGTGKSTLMEKIGIQWLNNGYDVEFMHSSADNKSFSGVVIPKLKTAIIDGSKPEQIELILSGVIKYIDLNSALNKEEIEKHEKEIDELIKEKQKLLQNAYDSFAKALEVHDEWEKIYINNMDFNKANELTEDLIKILLANKKIDKESVVRQRFLGAATPEGPVDFINNLTSDIGKRYFIKGRPGSGKSTMLKKVVSAAQQLGFDTEVYHCGFDPDSLDMVILRELDVAVFDSTAPHEYFPDRGNDEIVDVYEKAINAGTDEKYALELKDIVRRYKTIISDGTLFLMKAKKVNDKVKGIYQNAMNYDYADKIAQKINLEIDMLIH